jgi:hypothetical protein
VLAQRAAARLGVASPRGLRFASRLPSVLWFAALLLTVFLGTRRLVSEHAAHLATTACALDPNLVAHASLVTVDALYALATLVSLLAGLAFARAPSARRAAALGLALGLAFATKFSAFLLLPGLLFLPLPWREWRRLLLFGVLTATTAATVILLAYLGHAGAFRDGLLRSVGSERGWGPVVLLGRAHPDGVFYYFAVLWALKTPLLLAFLQATGLVLLMRSGRLLREPALRFLALNAALAFLYFSLLFKTQIGYRFVLMLIPLAWILATAGLEHLRGARAKAFGALALAVAVAENAAYLGNPLSFTSLAVHPKRSAFRLMADSNLDWGQNREKVGDWLAAQGIRASRLDPVQPLVGQNVFSVNALSGVFDFEQHRWLREHAEPLEHWGHTYLRFELDAEAFERFMDEERRLAPGPNARALCPEALAYEPYHPGGQHAFLRETAPEAARVWAVCVTSERGVDLGVRMGEGRLRFGRFTPGRQCEAVLLQDEQVAWQRLLPGTHALCALEVPNRREYLRYRMEASLILRGHAAALSVRPLATDANGAAIP